MGRRYKVVTGKVSCSAKQDLLAILGAAGKIVRILRVTIAVTDSTPTNQQLPIRYKIGSATVTLGVAGGGSTTPLKVDLGDAGASFTAHKNDTTQATTTGAFTIPHEDSFNAYAGFNDTLLSPIPIGPSEGFVLELDAPGAAATLDATIEVEEIGG